MKVVPSTRTAGRLYRLRLEKYHSHSTHGSSDSKGTKMICVSQVIFDCGLRIADWGFPATYFRLFWRHCVGFLAQYRWKRQKWGPADRPHPSNLRSVILHQSPFHRHLHQENCFVGLFFNDSRLSDPQSVFSGFTFQNHDCEIVNRAGFADESGEGFINAVAQSRGGAPAVLLNNFDQTRLAELFALFVETFGHPVGINDHDVTRFDFD